MYFKINLKQINVLTVEVNQIYYEFYVYAAQGYGTPQNYFLNDDSRQESML